MTQESIPGIFARPGGCLHDDRAVCLRGSLHDGLNLFQVVYVESRQAVTVFGCVIEQLAHGYKGHRFLHTPPQFRRERNVSKKIRIRIGRAFYPAKGSFREQLERNLPMREMSRRLKSRIAIIAAPALIMTNKNERLCLDVSAVVGLRAGLFNSVPRKHKGGEAQTQDATWRCAVSRNGQASPADV
jgi:hypothetical protein